MSRVSKVWKTIGVAICALALMAGTAVANHIFNDVPDGAFYAVPAEWAADNGITLGCGNNNFCPDRDVTRGENITFAYRYDQNIVQPELAAIEARLEALENNKVFTVSNLVNFSQVSITDDRSSVASVTVDAPAAGTVVVHASGTGVETAAGVDIRCQISTTESPSSSNIWDFIWEASGATTGSAAGEGDAGVLAGTRPFSVAAGSSTTFHLACAVTANGETGQVWGPKLTAIFIPN